MANHKRKKPTNNTMAGEDTTTTVAAPATTAADDTSTAAPPTNGGGVKFNKMFVMIPVMLAARKLDAEDPQIVQYLRLAYGSVQTLCVLVVLYTYFQASSLSATKKNDNDKEEKTADTVVYVPAPATPFADPNSTQKKYTQTDYQAHVVSTARSLVGSTLFGVAMTVGLHYYKGMAMGLAIQTIMGPFNLMENPLVKALLLGHGFRRDDKIFDEKTVEELTDDDDVVDASGNEVPKHALLGGGTSTTKTLQGDTKSNKKKNNKKKKDGTAVDAVAFDTVLLDTWDLGNQADIPHFLTQMTKDNCNHRTADSGWTPLMILAGLDAPGTVDGIQAVLALGGNAAMTDGEGWHALHWSAFHGSLVAAHALMAHAPSLLTVRDTDGKSAFDMATTEGNTAVAQYLAECTKAAAAATASTNDEPSEKGLRKRK